MVRARDTDHAVVAGDRLEFVFGVGGEFTPLRIVAGHSAGIATVGVATPKVMDRIVNAIDAVPTRVDNTAIIVDRRRPFIGLVERERNLIAAVRIHGM